MEEKIERQCGICNQGFKPMTEKQWEFIYSLMHVPISARHKKYLKLAQ